MNKTLSLAVLALAVLAGCATRPYGPARMSEDGMLVNAEGITLYTYDRDSAGRSMCMGDCAVDWKPYVVTGNMYAPAEYSVITREDGIRQWTYKGKPLYTFPQDTDPGDKFGDGSGGAWRIIAP